MLSHDLPWLHSQPVSTGMIKVSASDFQVFEDLGYQPDGEGEQLLVKVRKIGCNTRFVADALARYLKIPQREVSFAGMKDRHAITEQTFCLRLPGKAIPDLSGFNLEGVTILAVERHQRKIRTGALAGNAFELILRGISDPADVEQRLASVKAQGVPNYFGEQRFGRDGHNLTLVQQWAQGKITIRDRNKRSLLLSAARSAVFNQVTAQRLKQHGNLSTLLLGDAVQLAGRGSWFIAQADDLEEIKQRLTAQQLRLTGPLPGRGEPGPKADALAFELSELALAEEIVGLLIREKVATGRRAMLVIPRDLQWQWLDAETLKLNFWLPAGSFATTVVRELLTATTSGEAVSE